MNWMQVELGTLRWKSLAFGATAGLWGGVLHDAALALPVAPGWLVDRNLLAGAALGLGITAVLAPVDALVRSFFRRALRTALAGALLGALAGLAGTVANGLLPQAFALVAQPHIGDALARWIGPAVALGLVGAGSGLAAGFGQRRARQALRMGLMGLVLGMAISPLLPAAILLPLPTQWSAAGALVLWGALLSLLLHWWSRRRSKRWLRLLTGPGEDEIFPLQGPQVTLGKNEVNDIPLRHFQEVYPFHCELHWSVDHYRVVDSEHSGVVLVNYRQVQEHDLRPGDMIKVGSALLQYGEAS